MNNGRQGVREAMRNVGLPININAFEVHLKTIRDSAPVIGGKWREIIRVWGGHDFHWQTPSVHADGSDETVDRTISFLKSAKRGRDTPFACVKYTRRLDAPPALKRADAVL